MEKETLSLVKDKKFTEFSRAVKQELNNKMNNHPEIKKYKSSHDKIQDMKQQFADIHSSNKSDVEDTPNKDVEDTPNKDVEDTPDEEKDTNTEE